MFDAQRVMYLSLKLRVRADLVRIFETAFVFITRNIGGDRSAAISRSQDFSNHTSEVICSLSFEGVN